MTTAQDTEDQSAAPAHSDDAERHVLGALMLQPRIVGEIANILTAADFYRPTHAAIYAAITSNAALGAPTDPVALARTLAKFGELNRLPGGAAYLHTLMDALPPVVSATWYAGQVAESAYARRAEAATIRLRDAARSGSREAIDVAYDRLQQDLAAAPGDTNGWRARLINGASFIFDIPEKVAAVWGDGDSVLWAAGEALMICGPQGVGKTTLAGQVVAARLGLIPEVLGWTVASGTRRVLYLAMDRPQQAARSLGRLMREEWRETIRERLVVWQGPPPADMASSPAMLAEMCRAADADTVVIDSVKDAAVGLAKDEIGAGYNRARQTAIAAGVEVLELHHQRKAGDGGKQPKTLSDVYGSTWIPSGAGSVLLLWGEAGDPVVELLHVKQPRNDVGPLTIIHDHETGRSRVDRENFARDLVYLTGRQPHGMTPRAAAVALFSVPDPDRNQVEKARYRLDSYVKKGVMVCREGARGGGGERNPAAYFLVERREEDR
jgi:replicative DNA helicase